MGQRNLILDTSNQQLRIRLILKKKTYIQLGLTLWTNHRDALKNTKKRKS